MKRRNLLRHLREQGCLFVREGSDHTIVTNPANGRQSEVPRHREIKFRLVRKICRDLDVTPPSEK
ncbi:MAG: type II toxin-antitoxin system HicA family toxin [Planctomycetes bacterium]|nr:type II toxin-antitoxin system HicA family toxin [Planctomycetota bacterium]